MREITTIQFDNLNPIIGAVMFNISTSNEKKVWGFSDKEITTVTYNTSHVLYDCYKHSVSERPNLRALWDVFLMGMAEIAVCSSERFRETTEDVSCPQSLSDRIRYTLFDDKGKRSCSLFTREDLEEWELMYDLKTLGEDI